MWLRVVGRPGAREFALLPAAAYAAVLTVAPLSAVFVVLGGVLLISAWYARYLPKAL